MNGNWIDDSSDTEKNSGIGRALFVAGHRQVISRISKGSQNILTCMYNFIITPFDCQGRGIFALARPDVEPPLETKREVWLFRTRFGIAPVNKLVSLT